MSRRTRISLDVAAPRPLDTTTATSLGLTPREAEVLSLVAAGRTNREIATALFVSEKTASVHVSNILRKLSVTSRVEAAVVAQRLGLD
jgi:DNA-binding NarL/FixJ family response regulator